MKKACLLMAFVVSGLIAFGQSQPDNIDIGLFAVGSHGSNTGLGAYVEVSLRVKPGGSGYNAIPIAENYGVYLIAPKTDFSLSDVVQITEVNSSIFGTTATSVMIDGGVLDIGANDPNNWYFPIILNSAAGLNLHALDGVTNTWSFSFTFNFNNPKTQAAFNKLKIVDQTNNAALSAYAGGQASSVLEIGGVNQLTSVGFSTLPVSLLNFSGYKNGSKNTLQWTTGSESNDLGFDVLRSNDGINYSSIGFVNSQAPNGTSATAISYTFDDNNPAAGRKQYYRLNQKDIDGRSRLSTIISITGDKPTSLGISGLYPNPAREQVNVIIDAPQKDDITIVVTDMSGKTVKQKLVNVDTGSNTEVVDVSGLASGSYLVKLVCRTSDCATATAKFNKL